MKKYGQFARVSLGAIMLGATPAAALAQSSDEEIVVTGVRGAGRTVLESPVPIDVLSADSIGEVSFTDTNDVLRTLVPSFSLEREPISDGATFIRPAQLRGLPSDKTLLLVNSKRRHRSSLVEIGGAGSQAPDAATIPASAIGRVEVLRDGAAAQYGSDAIAGVINFILKDDAEGGSLTFRTGQYYEGDGEDVLLTGNIGMPLLDFGFVNVSFEYSSAQGTGRGEQYCNVGGNRFCALETPTAEYLAAGPLPAADAAYFAAHPEFFDLVRNPAQLWGQPEAEAFRSFVNAGLDLGGVELYGFANYSFSAAVGDFNYRPPTNSLNATVLTTPNGPFTFSQWFPTGFTPIFFGDVTDYSAVGGFKGEVFTGLSYDISARFGHNDIQYKLTHTMNPSMGPLSPTEFYLGELANEEWSINADFLTDFEIGLASPLTFAFGAEFLNEEYTISPGEEASYAPGPYAAFQPVGANGFPGFPPDYSGALKRESYGVYGELSADIFDSLFVDVAARFADYSDFGETTIGKIAARYEITDAFSLRGSVSSGFRAPTPGQLFTTNVSTRVTDGVVIASGLFPASNPVAAFLGAEPLGPEESTNYSAGFAAEFGGLELTVDFYQIEIADQFYASRVIPVTPAIRDQLIAANVPGAATIGQVQFYQNSFDSKVSGVDVVASYDLDWDSLGTTGITASFNYNKFEIEKVFDPFLFGAEEIYDFEEGKPEWRGTVAVAHEIAEWGFLARANMFGPYKNMFSAANPLIREFDPEVLVDLEASYDINETYQIAIGARNVFDEYPDPDGFITATGSTIYEVGNGAVYRQDSVVDWQGGFYYVRGQARF